MVATNGVVPSRAPSKRRPAAQQPLLGLLVFLAGAVVWYAFNSTRTLSGAGSEGATAARWQQAQTIGGGSAWRPLSDLLSKAAASVQPLPLAAQPTRLRPTLEDLAVTAEDKEACRAGGRKFRVHILDPNTILHLMAGMSNATCDIDSLLVWPHRQMWRGAEASLRTPHWAYQHAAGWWIKQALLRSGIVQLVDDIEQADIVFLDMHCFNTWAYSWMLPHGNHSQPPADAYPAVLFNHIAWLRRFKLRNGSDWVIVQTHPALMYHPGYRPDAKRCQMFLGNALYMAGEREMLCPEHEAGETMSAGVGQGRAMLLPYVSVEDNDFSQPVAGSHRNYLMFYRGGCAGGSGATMYQFSSGKLLRKAVVEGLREAARQAGMVGPVQVVCSAAGEDSALRHDHQMELLRDSVFCPMVAGDTQSSRRLTEVILSGCIPVFFGPIYHTLPLANEVDYKSFAVFFRVTDTSLYINYNKSYQDAWRNNGPVMLQRWRPDADLTDVEIAVEKVEDALLHIRNMTSQEIGRLQAALDRERLKLLYTEDGLLGDLVVCKVCERAAVLQRLEQREAERRTSQPEEQQREMPRRQQVQQEQGAQQGAQQEEGRGEGPGGQAAGNGQQQQSAAGGAASRDAGTTGSGGAEGGGEAGGESGADGGRQAAGSNSEVAASIPGASSTDAAQ